MSDRHLKLTELRKRSGMSMNDLAKAMGYNGQSSIQRYFAPSYDLGFRPEVAKKFRNAMLGKGNPPITESDLRIFTAEDEGGVDANRIAEQRTNKGMTQQQLADALGVHWMTISKLERGEMQLTARWMDKISSVLNVQYQDLLNPQSETRQANGLTLTATLPCAEGEITVEMPKAMESQTAEAALAWFSHLVGLARRA